MEATMSVSDCRKMLQQHRMFIEDPEADQRGAALFKKARNILTNQRRSLMTNKAAARIIETLRFYSVKNEKTLLINLWQLLVNDFSLCKKKQSSGEEEILSPEEEANAAHWIKRA